MQNKPNGNSRAADPSGLEPESESWRKAIAQYKAGSIDRPAMIRAVMEAAAPWDATGRDMIYMQAETMLGEHVCDWAIECEHGHQDVVDRWISYKRENEIDAMRLRPHPYEFYLYYDV